jgi:hypothetical protein
MLLLISTYDSEKGYMRNLHSSGENGRITVCVNVITLESFVRSLPQNQKDPTALAPEQSFTHHSITL